MKTTERQTGHTAGPWHVAQYGDSFDKSSAKQFHAVKIGSSSIATGILGIEDARLIAAAPDLLEACREFVKHFAGITEPFTNDQNEAVMLAMQAIAKATQ